MKDWKIYKLKEITTKIGSGSTPRGGKSAYSQQGIALVRSLNVYDFNFEFKDLAFINEQQAKKLNAVTVEREDILLNITGASVGRCTIIPEILIPARVNQHVSIIRCDSKKVEPTFLLYCINSSFYKEALMTVADSGATREALTKSDIENFQVLLPELLTQKAIAYFISRYDELIKANNHRIQLLEETARELYKEWFVRMRFPEYKKTKFAKGIPTDWKISPIGEVIDYHIGGGWGNDVPDDYFNTPGYVIRGTDIPGIKLGTVNRDVYRFHKASNMKSRELLEGDIVFETAGGSEGQPLGRTCFITQELLDAYGDKVMAASFCKQIRTNSIPSLYLYYFLNYLYDSGLIEAFQTQSTGISNYQFGPFLKFQQIIIPNENLMQEFHNIALTIQKQIAILGQQNTELRQTRDRLLPRLIGGKLQVKLNTDCNTTKSTESRQVIDKPEKSTEDTKLKSNPFFQRRVLATHIIDRLKDEPTFGHVKLMKLMYLCEHLAEIETASHYHRDAAGPYDNRMIRSIDSQLKKAQWFECKKTGNRYLYTALPKKEEYKNWFTKYYSDKEAGIENLLHLFGKEKTEKAEMVATLYEASRDLKDKKQLPTEQAIIYEVLNNWHESKQRISEERWLKCLQWMKEKNWIT